MSAKAGKRPLRSLTAHEKLDAIRRVHDGESKASVARDIGVPESTLRGWCKNEDKISYLSRQSSPETDDSGVPPVEHKDSKRQKLEEPLQPYNLSMKNQSPGVSFAPASQETRYPDFTKSEIDAAKSIADLSMKAETPKSATHERERNRAELARLSVELGLNRPEIFLHNAATTGNVSMDVSNNIGLLAQWNNILLQQQLLQKTPSTTTNNNSSKKITAAADTSTNIVTSSAAVTPPKYEQEQKPKLPKLEAAPSVEDSVWYWLKTQQAMLGAMGSSLPTSNGLPTPAIPSCAANPTSSAPTDQNSSWFWKWYKQFATTQQLQPPAAVPDKPILYQQLTKSKDVVCNTENISHAEEKHSNHKNNPKARAVLDNLLFNNNNNVTVNKREVREDAVLTQYEALEHGEKFLKWLETCSEPSVTAMQIMQFRYLLNNIKNGAERKNGEAHNKTKVKRK